MGEKSDLRRFFVESIPLVPAAVEASRVELSTAESHHAMHVLRLAAGDDVELLDGRGSVAAGKIVQAKHGKVLVQVMSAPPQIQRPQPAIHLAFAVPKGKRLDWLLEKATELGAASLWPVVFERSVAGGDELGEGKRERWLSHCVSAAKQSGQAFLPELHELEDVSVFIGMVTGHRGVESDPTPGMGLCLVGDLSDGAMPLTQALASHEAGREVMILVGPEGGITDHELQQLQDAGFACVRLGRTTLRIETAAVALLAACEAILET